jgi:hypothetical protein
MDDTEESSNRSSERRNTTPYSSTFREDENRKRADGKGEFDWDSRHPPKTKNFDSEEAYREAYEQWARHVERRIGIDPDNWPHRMNVSDTVDMCREVLDISRSTFYRWFRSLFEFDAQTMPIGRKAAFREKVIETIMCSDEINREMSGIDGDV